MFLKQEDLKIIFDDNPHATGKAKAFRFEGEDTQYPWRVEYLEKLVAGKKVIHVGCADHLIYIDEKIKNNTHLHRKLFDSATRCVGIDIETDALAHLKSKHGFTDLYDLNIIQEELPDAIKSDNWDYVLLPEMLEHVDNPLLFIKNIADKFRGIATHIVITVPSAIRFKNFTYMLRAAEQVNSDHRYYFSPVTLTKLLSRADITMEEFYFCDYVVTRKPRIKKWMSKYFGASRDSLVAICRI